MSALRSLAGRALVAMRRKSTADASTEEVEVMPAAAQTQESVHYLLADPLYGPVIERVQPFTLTSCERIAALIDATRYVARLKIPGAIVECGVWRGGSIMAAAVTLMELGDIRDLYLFDTFTGMTAPTAHDVDMHGVSAHQEYRELKVGDQLWSGQRWQPASVEDVRNNVLSTGYPEDRVHFIAGDVLQTIPCAALSDIAILRLDTDWYESTLHELQHLYPQLRPGGILIVDDFGYWQGCRRAVQEYFGQTGPFLSIIDQTGRLAVKLADPSRALS